jgi:ribonuclease HI
LVDSVILEIDGASKGNPGNAGSGYLISRDGEILARGKRYLGITTNNVAEYKAMIMGLSRAAEMGFKEITVKTDSLLVSRQIEGEYRVRKEHLRKLCDEARKLIGRFKSVKIEYVPSERNRAHPLAEDAATMRD